MYSLEAQYAYQQAGFILLGVIIYILAAQLPSDFYEGLSVIAYPVSLIALLVTLIIGWESRGAVRWVDFGFFRFQPSEIVKPLVISFLAGIGAKHDFRKITEVFKYAFWSLLPVFLVFKQPDLGNAIVYLSVSLAVIVAAGIKPLYLAISSIAGFLFLPLGWDFLKSYQKERFLSFLNPEHDPQGSGYNALQAVIAVGSGGLLGRGLGMGDQSRLKFLPERHTDFIFASMSEELGFVGAVILIILFGLLLFRILTIAENQETKFKTLMAVGIFTMIFTQVIINVGMNMGLVPITGITLPMVSYGGSSIISVFIGLGMIAHSKPALE